VCQESDVIKESGVGWVVGAGVAGMVSQERGVKNGCSLERRWC